MGWSPLSRKGEGRPERELPSGSYSTVSRSWYGRSYVCSRVLDSPFFKISKDESCRKQPPLVIYGLQGSKHKQST